jgi:hypothetical protein
MMGSKLFLTFPKMTVTVTVIVTTQRRLRLQLRSSLHAWFEFLKRTAVSNVA